MEASQKLAVTPLGTTPADGTDLMPKLRVLMGRRFIVAVGAWAVGLVALPELAARCLRVCHPPG